MTEFIPHAYQQQAIEHVLNNEATGLFLDMGLGKTVITLTALEELLLNCFDVSRVLVIAPKRVAEDTWSREADKWAHLRHLRISKVLGTEKQRIAGLAAPAHIYVTNRENVPWLVKHLGKGWFFDMVVIDELSSFKSSGSQRFRALRKVRPKVQRIVGLTGTPAPNSLIDLWAQVFLLDRGARLGETVGGYRRRWFTPGRSDPSRHIVFDWRLKAGAAEEIEDELRDICISMKAKDYLSLPKRIDNVVEVHLSSKDRKQYKELEKELLLELAEGDVVAENAAALMGKLLQYAQGAVYDEDKAVHELHSAKLDALADVIEEAHGQPVLVFYNFKHDLSRIQKRFKQAETLDGENQIAKWNAGEIPLLLAHPASAGHGLNLQDGGHIVVWFGLTWSLELYQQANARLDRQGQKQAVIVHHLIAAGTADERVLEILQKKEQGQDALLRALKAQQEAVT